MSLLLYALRLRTPQHADLIDVQCSLLSTALKPSFRPRCANRRRSSAHGTELLVPLIPVHARPVADQDQLDLGLVRDHWRRGQLAVLVIAPQEPVDQSVDGRRAAALVGAAQSLEWLAGQGLVDLNKVKPARAQRTGRRRRRCDLERHDRAAPVQRPARLVERAVLPRLGHLVVELVHPDLVTPLVATDELVRGQVAVDALRRL